MKPTTVANTGNQAIFNKLKGLIETNPDESLTDEQHAALKDKMLTVLLLNYIDTHHQGVQQLGFLTGNKTYKTYLLKMTHDHSNKRGYQKAREELRQLFDDQNVENNFEFDSNGIRYLADLNHEKLKKVEDLIKRTQGVAIEM